MKLIVYKVNKPNNRNKQNNNSRKSVKANFERVLFLSFIIMFTILVITQTALMSPSIKTFIPLNSGYEGTQLGVEEFLYKRGEISLELQNVDSDDKLKVLINGEVIGAFFNKTLELNVKEGDVIELDGSEVNTIDEVKIISISANINPYILNKKLRISSGVERLTDIQIN
jgi:hypothetical protein